jgi:hypothetical protein
MGKERNQGGSSFAADDSHLVDAGHFDQLAVYPLAPGLPTGVCQIQLYDAYSQRLVALPTGIVSYYFGDT